MQIVRFAKMNRFVLMVLYLVTVSNVQLQQSQCDGEVLHHNTVIQFHSEVCGSIASKYTDFSVFLRKLSTIYGHNIGKYGRTQRS